MLLAGGVRRRRRRELFRLPATLPVLGERVQRPTAQINENPPDDVRVDVDPPEREHPDDRLRHRLRRPDDTGRQRRVVRRAEKDQVVQQTAHRHDQQECRHERDVSDRGEAPERRTEIAERRSEQRQADEDVTAIEVQRFDGRHLLVRLGVLLYEQEVGGLAEHARAAVRVRLPVHAQVAVTCKAHPSTSSSAV